MNLSVCSARQRRGRLPPARSGRRCRWSGILAATLPDGCSVSHCVHFVQASKKAGYVEARVHRRLNMAWAEDRDGSDAGAGGPTSLDDASRDCSDRKRPRAESRITRPRRSLSSSWFLRTRSGLVSSRVSPGRAGMPDWRQYLCGRAGGRSGWSFCVLVPGASASWPSFSIRPKRGLPRPTCGHGSGCTRHGIANPNSQREHRCRD